MHEGPCGAEFVTCKIIVMRNVIVACMLIVVCNQYSCVNALQRNNLFLLAASHIQGFAKAIMLVSWSAMCVLN